MQKRKYPEVQWSAPPTQQLQKPMKAVTYCSAALDKLWEDIKWEGKCANAFPQRKGWVQIEREATLSASVHGGRGVGLPQAEPLPLSFTASLYLSSPPHRETKAMSYRNSPRGGALSPLISHTHTHTFLYNVKTWGHTYTCESINIYLHLHTHTHTQISQTGEVKTMIILLLWHLSRGRIY